FCMGGELSGNLACVEPDLRAAVIFYGPAPDDERLPGIACPLLGLYGADDARVTDAVPGFEQRLAQLGKPFSYFVYKDSPHAFFNDTRPSYRPEAARDAWARTLCFFAEQLV
ncbi:Carboxymethylenebutenolidase, partial [mine drainage metagenome]